MSHSRNLKSLMGICSFTWQRDTNIRFFTIWPQTIITILSIIFPTNSKLLSRIKFYHWNHNNSLSSRYIFCGDSKSNTFAQLQAVLFDNHPYLLNINNLWMLLCQLMSGLMNELPKDNNYGPNEIAHYIRDSQILLAIYIDKLINLG